jgi:hypothetical protein
MILNLIAVESNRLAFEKRFLSDDRYYKLNLISAGAVFKKQKRPWLLEVYLEDAIGKRSLDCVLIAPSVDFFNFKLTPRIFHTLRTQNLDQVNIIFQAKHGYVDFFEPLIAYANLELFEYDGGFQEPKITRKILGEK